MDTPDTTIPNNDVDNSLSLKQLQNILVENYTLAEFQIIAGTMLIDTLTHLIKIMPFRDGFMVDFFATGQDRTQTSVETTLTQGGIKTTKIIKAIVLELARNQGLNIYAKPSDERRSEVYGKLAERYNLKEKIIFI